MQLQQDLTPLQKDLAQYPQTINQKFTMDQFKAAIITNLPIDIRLRYAVTDFAIVLKGDQVFITLDRTQASLDVDSVLKQQDAWIKANTQPTPVPAPAEEAKQATDAPAPKA